MKIKTYPLWLMKAYFDEGWNVLNYLKYVFFIFGFKFLSATQTIIVAIIYGSVCLALGFCIYKFRWIEEIPWSVGIDHSSGYNGREKNRREDVRDQYRSLAALNPLSLPWKHIGELQNSGRTKRCGERQYGIQP